MKVSNGSGLPVRFSRSRVSALPWLVIAAVLIFVAGHTHASPQAGTGSWLGPWDWSSSINAPPPAYPPGGCTHDLDEFSHAALIADGPYRGKVLMWRLAINQSCTTFNKTVFWIFDPLQPTQLLKVTESINRIAFCAGASWDANGQLVIVGALPFGSGPCATTARETWLFRPRLLSTTVTGTNPPVIQALPGSLDNPLAKRIGDMVIPRYYPTLIPLTRLAAPLNPACVPSAVSGGGSVVLGGPDNDPASCTVATSNGNEFWEYMEPGGTNWSCPVIPATVSTPHLPYVPTSNTTYSLHDPSGSNPPSVLLDSYPRALQLSTDEIFVAFDVLSADHTTPPAGNAAGDSWVVRPQYSSMSLSDWQLWRGQSANYPGVDNDRNYGCAVLMHTLAFRDRVVVLGGNYLNSGVNTMTKSVQEFVWRNSYDRWRFHGHRDGNYRLHSRRSALGRIRNGVCGIHSDVQYLGFVCDDQGRSHFARYQLVLNGRFGCGLG